MNVTATVRLAVRLLIIQVCPDTESQPFQPPKVDPELGVAVTLIAVPLAKLALQFAAQLIPEGVLVTLPVPAPTN